MVRHGGVFHAGGPRPPPGPNRGSTARARRLDVAGLPSRMAMPYTHTAADGRAHYLHGKTVVFPDGRREPIYWFARAPQVGKTVATLPTGYRIKESPVTRRPYLRRA